MAGGIEMRRRARRTPAAPARSLVPLIRKSPAVLEVLDRHGVHFCAGCYLTLASPLDRVAAYHAVPDLGRFLGDLAQAVKRRSWRPTSS